MTFWTILWKATLIGGLAIFGLMAIWVTIFGFVDIRRLFARIEESHRREDEEETSD